MNKKKNSEEKLKTKEVETKKIEVVRKEEEYDDCGSSYYEDPAYGCGGY
jgi:hypothetical protein